MQASEFVRVVPERAFLLFTEHIGDWYRIDKYTVFDPAQTKTLRLEGFVGGQFLDVTDRQKGTGNLLGTVSLWEPPSRFSFIDLHECEVAVSFQPEGQGTRVTVDVRGLEKLAPTHARQARLHGWHTTLSWFEQWSRSSDG